MGVVEHVADEADTPAATLQNDGWLDQLGELGVRAGVYVGGQRREGQSPQELLHVVQPLVELVVAQRLFAKVRIS